MRAPTNPVSVNCVGTGVLDRPLPQQNLRTVREAGPYVHRDRLCEIKDPDKPELVWLFLYLTRRDFYPDGDYYFHIEKYGRFGYLSHPWREEVWIFGEKLLREFDEIYEQIGFVPKVVLK